MVEDRRIRFNIPPIEPEYRGFGERHEIVRDLLNGARVEQLADPNLLRQKYMEFAKARTIPAGQDSMAKRIKMDIQERVGLIQDDGDISIGHLGISQGTLNSILRADSASINAGLRTIEGVRKALTEGIVLTPDAVPESIALKSDDLKDIVRALAEFDSLGEPR